VVRFCGLQGEGAPSGAAIVWGSAYGLRFAGFQPAAGALALPLRTPLRAQRGASRSGSE